MADKGSVVILRDLARARRGGGGRLGRGPVLESFSGPDRFAPPGGLGGREADPQIAVEARDKQILDEASRDPAVVAVAETMPLALIEPLSDDAIDASERQDGAVAAAAADGVTWGVRAVKADQSMFSGANVTVAILDTGIDRSHAAFNVPDLQLITQDFTGTTDADTHGHGTHCAGTVFGRPVDNTRIGVAPGVRRAIIAKVIGGGAGTDALITGMEWAISNGAQVISMSLGFDFPGFRERLAGMGLPAPAATSRALEAYRDNIRLFDEWMALNAAREASNGAAVVVAAAGNESRRRGANPYEIGASSPSAANDVVSVAALASGSSGLSVASFSNTNPVLAAPGVAVVSARAGGGLVAMNGTSMACPHVAGLAALYWDQLIASPVRPRASTVVNRLVASCRHAGVFAPGTDLTDVGVGVATAP